MTSHLCQTKDFWVGVVEGLVLVIVLFSKYPCLYLNLDLSPDVCIAHENGASILSPKL